MRIEHAPTFDEYVRLALRWGAARADRIPFNTVAGALLCLRHPHDGDFLWLTYRPEVAATWVTDIQHYGWHRQLVYGDGCDLTGFRLSGRANHVMFRLLASAVRPMTVVRGRVADFTGAQSPCAPIPAR